MFSSAPKKQQYPTGTRVEAKVKGWKKHYWGEIIDFSTKTGTYSIRFDDGETKTNVKGFNIKASSVAETFTAPDGKTFTDRNLYRRYLAETMYSFKDKTGETLIKRPGDIDGQTFNISNLKDCQVQLMDHSDQVLIDGLENCKVLIGPSCESVFVRQAKNCQLFIACKQFRSRDCENCTISLYTKTEPIVETSSGMLFYPYSCAYPGQTSHFEKARLIPDHNHWCNVFDFNAGDSSIPEPHWALVEEADGWPVWEIQLESIDASPENPVPKTARAKPSEKETGFAIGISQEQALQAFEAHKQAQEQRKQADLSANETNQPQPAASPESNQPEAAPAPPPAGAIPSDKPREATVVSVFLTPSDTVNGNVAVITGGASGIGLEAARRCAANGMKVAIGDVNLAALKEAEQSLGQTTDVYAEHLDVSDSTQVAKFEENIRNRFPGTPIAFLFNNAAVMGGMSVLNSSSEEVKTVLDTNVNGVVHVFQTFLPSIAKQGCVCHVVTNSSFDGLVTAPSGIYSASKFAVTGVTECVFHEVQKMKGGEFIKMHLLCPSYTATPMWKSPGAMADKQTQIISDAIHKVVHAKGLTAMDVVDAMFAGINSGMFCIIVNDPKGNGEIEGMVANRAQDLIAGKAPRKLVVQKLMKDIQQEIKYP